MACGDDSSFIVGTWFYLESIGVQDHLNGPFDKRDLGNIDNQMLQAGDVEELNLPNMCLLLVLCWNSCLVWGFRFVQCSLLKLSKRSCRVGWGGGLSQDLYFAVGFI